MIEVNTFVRVSNRKPPSRIGRDWGIVSSIDEHTAMVSFPGSYPEPWPLVMLEQVENSLGIAPMLLLGQGGFYSQATFFKNVCARLEAQA